MLTYLWYLVLTAVAAHALSLRVRKMRNRKGRK